MSCSREQIVHIIFCFKPCKTASETCDMLQAVFGDRYFINAAGFQDSIRQTSMEDFCVFKSNLPLSLHLAYL
jgi:hypothetical protein